MQPEEVEKLLMRLRRQRDEAESEAAHARDRLARIASGLTPLDETNAEEMEGAANDFASAVRRLRLLDEIGADLRQLLM